MCRSIQQLRGADPSATDAEVRAAALQYVRKISGYRVPSKANEAVFTAAVDDIAAVTRRLLDGLVVGAGSHRRSAIASEIDACVQGPGHTRVTHDTPHQG